MNLKFLDTFLWVARLKSFRLAADQLFTTQAAVAGRVTTLEEDLGVKLLLRDTRTVSLTAEGHKVVEYAERMLELERDLRQTIDARHSGARRIRVGVLDLVVHGWFAVFMARVEKAFPDLQVELTVDTARNLREQLLKGQLELIVQTDPIRHDSLRNCALGTYPMAWVAASNFPSVQHISELASERLLTLARNSRPHQDLLSLLQASGIDAPRLTCIDSLAALVQLLGEGFGVGVLPPLLVSEALSQGKLRLLDLTPQPLALDVVACWRVGAGLEQVEDVVEIAESLVREFIAGPGLAR